MMPCHACCSFLKKQACTTLALNQTPYVRYLRAIRGPTEVTEEGSLPPTLHQEATTRSIVNHSLQLRATGANTCHGRASKSQRASPSQLDQNMLSLGRALYIRAECSFLKLHPSLREVFKSELVIAVAICPELVSNISGASPLKQALQDGCASALLLQSPIIVEALTHNALACGQRIMANKAQGLPDSARCANAPARLRGT